MIILSGIAPGPSGVGRLVACLADEAAQRPGRDVEILWRKNPWKLPYYLRRGRLRESVAAIAEHRQWRKRLDDPRWLAHDPLVLIHPQTLRYGWCLELIGRRRPPTWMYVMDSSFFCLPSYNHVPGERTACTRCLGGNWSCATRLGCRPAPLADAQAAPFVHKLRGWMIEGRVKCLVQNRTQAELIQAHCGGKATVEVVGLWTSDLNLQEDAVPRGRNDDAAFDVVFHGAPVSAKGAHWAMEVAKHCAGLSFLFPNPWQALRPRVRHMPSNVTFRPMTWETGLADAVAGAKLVLVPSLWSATIEGALVKSIVAGRAVAVVAEPTAFSSELPDDLVLQLPADPRQAAAQLAHAVATRWQPPRDVWAPWVANFRRGNLGLLARLVATCAAAHSSRETTARPYATARATRVGTSGR
jgi:hypothetical protein